MFEEISEELKQARLKNNITIEQLSAKTRIDVKFIDAMEIGDFAFLPELYVKAFIKQYAKAVDLDENVIVKKYESVKAGIPFQDQKDKNTKVQDTAGDSSLQNKEKKIIEEPNIQPTHTFDAVGYSKSKVRDSLLSEKNRLMFGGIIVAVVFIFAFVYFFFIKKSDDIIIPEKPIEEIIQETKDRYTDNSENDSTALVNKAFISDSLSLTIIAKDTSWIKIILDDKRSDEFILFPKSQKVIAAGNNYKITFGNSGGIELILNNKSLNFIGRDKGIKYVLIDKNGLKYLQNPPSL